MKKIIAGVFSLIFATGLYAQTIGNEAFPQLKDGLLDLNLRTPGQKLRFGGYLQGSGYYTDIKNAESEYGFDVDHAYLSLEGSFLNEKLGFFLQADFADSYPLLDAWVSYSPWKQLKISAGQKQTFTNSRQMMMLDQGLAFGERSLLDRTFSRTGRELGLFVESRLPLGKLGLDLGAAVTSGDGRNSFGSSSTDPDNGGLKYGARATLYPFGFFTSGNESVFNDFIREKTPKLAIGAAYSYNVGASNAVGEGHGDFLMYDKEGLADYPDYRKLSADLLFKWNGFSLLAEYVNATANGLNGLYIQPDEGAKLKPRQIADYLALGNGFNVQAGYLFPKLWALDLAYSKVKPEWTETETSILRKTDNITFGASKYFFNNTFKIQLAGSYTSYKQVVGDASKEFQVKLNLHLLF